MSLLGLPMTHILPVFLGTSVSVACIPAYFNAPYAIRLFGLPERIATSPAAVSPWMLYSARIQSLAMMILVFYARGDYAAVDTTMAFIGCFGIADVYVCLKEGVPGKAWERGIWSFVVGLYGLAGVTQVSAG
jgi:hypothetical protein